MKNPVDFNRFGLLLASLAAAIAAVCLFLLPVPQTNSNEKREGALRLLGVSGSFGPEDLYRKFGKPLKVSFWQDKHSDLHEPKAWDIEYRGVVFHITHSAEMGGYTVNWIDSIGPDWIPPIGLTAGQARHQIRAILGSTPCVAKDSVWAYSTARGDVLATVVEFKGDRSARIIYFPWWGVSAACQQVMENYNAMKQDSGHVFFHNLEGHKPF